MSSSYAELTPVASCSSSTNSEMDAAAATVVSTTQQNIDAFNLLIEELEFEPSREKKREETEYSDVEQVPDTYDEDIVEEEEEIDIKYPYERKDVFEGLKERIEQRLKDSGDEELEKKTRELTQLLHLKQEEWKEEEKQERLESIRSLRDFSSSIFTCVMCSKAFADSDQLQTHIKQSHDLNGTNFKCKQCGMSYKRKKNLELHMKLHSREFECKQCSLVFQTEDKLEIHEDRFHSETEPLKKCPHCETHFHEKNFKPHVYYCQNKEKIAEKRKQLKAQSVPTSPALSTISTTSFMSYQPGPSSFRSPLASPIVSYRDKSCAVCGETFASRQSMLRHVGRKHPDVKNDPNVTAVRYVSTESPTHQYACVECGKRLTTRAALTQHRARAHAADSRKQECSHCQKSFVLPSELKKHIQRVHLNTQKSTTTSLARLDDLPEIEDIF
ncbi:hypothetical protein CRE_19903 [Caenorhabditis remanei]|uniref:C2H2-type domain-containing protein n=1 Tax=Caenorhabditis remanei TaxID=31234 RepID=E3N2X0_CAERE|nr:hypothetical protein CRE_19903 [Caenorhabditis remanei]